MRAKLLCTVPVLVSLAGCGAFSPRHSEETLTRNILAEVPLGSPMEQVQAQIARHGWKLDYVDMEHGFHDQRPRPSVLRGVRSIRADLGHYQGVPFRADVVVHWAFDASNRLTDIWVWKTWDSL